MSKIEKFLSKLSNRTIVIIAFIAIIGGILIISYDYLLGKKERAYQESDKPRLHERQSVYPRLRKLRRIMESDRRWCLLSELRYCIKGSRCNNDGSRH